MFPECADSPFQIDVSSNLGKIEDGRGEEDSVRDQLRGVFARVYRGKHQGSVDEGECPDSVKDMDEHGCESRRYCGTRLKLRNLASICNKAGRERKSRSRRMLHFEVRFRKFNHRTATSVPHVATEMPRWAGLG